MSAPKISRRKRGKYYRSFCFSRFSIREKTTRIAVYPSPHFAKSKHRTFALVPICPEPHGFGTSSKIKARKTIRKRARKQRVLFCVWFCVLSGKSKTKQLHKITKEKPKFQRELRGLQKPASAPDHLPTTMSGGQERRRAKTKKYEVSKKEKKRTERRREREGREES